MTVKREPLEDLEFYDFGSEDVGMDDAQHPHASSTTAESQPRRGKYFYQKKRDAVPSIKLGLDLQNGRSQEGSPTPDTPTLEFDRPLSAAEIPEINARLNKKGYAIRLNKKGRFRFLASDGSLSEHPKALTSPNTPDGFLPPASTIPPPPPRGSSIEPYNHIFGLSKDDPEHKRWRATLGNWLAKDVFKLPITASIIRIEDFPQYYALGVHYHYGKLKRPSPDGPIWDLRKDFYLYGSESGRIKKSRGRQVAFRSPEEFKLHALWLISDSGDCKCKYCDEEGYEKKRAEWRQRKQERKQGLITSPTGSASAPSTQLDMEKSELIAKLEKEVFEAESSGDDEDNISRSYPRTA